MYIAEVIKNKCHHMVQQNVQKQTTNTQIYPHQGQWQRHTKQEDNSRRINSYNT